MPSLFRSTQKKGIVNAPPKSFSVPSRERANSPQARQGNATTAQGSRHDAIRVASYTSSAGLNTSRSASAPFDEPLSGTSSASPIIPPKYTFAPTHLPTITVANSVDSFTYSQDEVTKNRHYGILGGVGAKTTLSLEIVAMVIKVVGKELERRALATPMLFSNQALELSPMRVRALIQAFMDMLIASRKTLWERDLAFAKDHELAWMLRWASSRILRVKEGTGEVMHGVIEWDVYEEWRGRERAASYRHSAFPYLAALIPAEVYHTIVNPLLSLLSRFAAHSHLSGLTPHALSSLFAPFLFDVPTSVPCLQSHAAYVRAASATEHLLLAHIRWSGQGEGLGVTDLPGRLKDWVSGYPSMVASDADLARAIPRRGARTIRCERVSRIVRAYSRDLVATAELWGNDISAWAAWERVVLKSRRKEASRPKFSNAWKRRMAVKDHLRISSSAASNVDEGYSGVTGSALNSETEAGRKASDDGEEISWGSLAGKEWSMFEEGGFDSPMSSAKGKEDMRSRLQFDLNESAKLTVTQKRQTMAWTDFAAPSGGFTRNDPVLDVSLSFAKPLSTSIDQWPKEREDLNRRLHKSQKESTPFDYDTTPKVGLDVMDSHARPDGAGRVFLEEAFVDWWADWGVGGGWVDRDELTFKEANWALIEYKARPSQPDEQSERDPLADPRTSDLYFLFEEKVPLDYQVAIANPQEKRTLATLFNSRKKRNNTPTKPRVGSGWDDSDFDRMLLHREKTKKITASPGPDAQASIWQMTPEIPSPKSPILVSAAPPSLIHSKSNRSRRNSGDHDPGVTGGKASFFSKSKERVVRRVKTEEATREKRKKQREKEVDFELNSASGMSSPDGSPKDGIKNGDEKWMDILVANGARRMDRQDAIPPRTKPVPATPRAAAAPGPPIATVSAAAPFLTPSILVAPVQLGAPLPPPLAAELEFTSPPRTIQETEGYAHYNDPAPASFGMSHSPETSGSDIEAVTPKGADVVRWGSGKRKPVPMLEPGIHMGQMEHLDKEEMRAYGGRVSYECERNEAPIPPLKDRPTSEVLSPRPQRDTIHNIVDTYRDSGASQGSEDLDEPYNSEPVQTIRYKYQGPPSGSEPVLLGEIMGNGMDHREDEVPDGVGELEPPKLVPVFDLTPGREPSPARYKHGEPLQFVGEESEEEE